MIACEAAAWAETVTALGFVTASFLFILGLFWLVLRNT